MLIHITTAIQSASHTLLAQARSPCPSCQAAGAGLDASDRCCMCRCGSDYNRQYHVPHGGNTQLSDDSAFHVADQQRSRACRDHCSAGILFSVAGYFISKTRYPRWCSLCKLF
jgi:hypothetical protein